MNSEKEARKQIRIVLENIVSLEDPHIPGRMIQFRDITGKDINQILALIEKAGYVKLADDQTLPRNPNLGIPAYFKEYKEAQQDMLDAGWRKVKVKDGS